MKRVHQLKLEANMKHSIIILFFLFFPDHFCIEEDYYWRNYFGTVPADAIIAGKSIDGKNIYIGQAYIKDEGLIVGQIFPGIKEVTVTQDGIKTVDKYIKILCGAQENFYWMKANATSLHVEITDKHAVIGGHEDKYGYMNIGRIKYSGDLKVGKVNSFWLERAFFYFNDNGTEKKLGSYEVLLYKQGGTDVDVRISSE